MPVITSLGSVLQMGSSRLSTYRRHCSMLMLYLKPLYTKAFRFNCDFVHEFVRISSVIFVIISPGYLGIG